jgi:AAA+ ATPase superfamily predicted ATPase
MRLFDTKPKTDPHFLYGREKELELLVQYLSQKDWVILLGPRRIGKTSLAECAVTKLGYKSILIDARDNGNFEQALVKSLKEYEISFNVKADVKVPHLPVNIELDYNRKMHSENIDVLLKRVGRLIILVDEAQWLHNPRRVNMLLAYLYDTYYDKITFIITGSMIGVMRSIVDPGPRSPLYGRAITKMEVKRWSSSVSINFLKSGTNELGLEMDDKTAVAIEERLDGLPGWLTLFGYNYNHLKDSNVALAETVKEAKKVVSEELKSISDLGIGTERLSQILAALAKVPTKFTALLEETGFSNAVLARHLNTLERLGYVEKNADNGYLISDPVLAVYIKESMQ